MYFTLNCLNTAAAQSVAEIHSLPAHIGNLELTLSSYALNILDLLIFFNDIKKNLQNAVRLL